MATERDSRFDVDEALCALSLEEFKQLLPGICDDQTSEFPDQWTVDRPLHGHSLLVSKIALQIFGGQLLRASLDEIPEFASMRSHYAIRLPNEEFMDFARSEFGDHYPDGLVFEERSDHNILAYSGRSDRYMLLFDRLIDTLYHDAVNRWQDAADQDRATGEGMPPSPQE